MLKRILSIPDEVMEVYADKDNKTKIDEARELLDKDDLIDDDILDDPEGIAIPLEEKYGKKDEKDKVQ